LRTGKSTAYGVKKNTKLARGTGYVDGRAILERINFAVSEKLVLEKSCEIRRERPERVHQRALRLYPLEEVTKIMKQRGEDTLRCFFLFRTGLRRSDFDWVRWKNVDFENETNQFNRTEKGKKVKVHNSCPICWRLESTKRAKRKPSTEELVLCNRKRVSHIKGKKLETLHGRLETSGGNRQMSPHTATRLVLRRAAFLRGCGTRKVAGVSRGYRALSTVAEHYLNSSKKEESGPTQKMRAARSSSVCQEDRQ